jgi:short-subunit dehydrogenase
VLRGKNALLTGAAGGLGAYIARALAAEGVNLALSDLPAARVEDLISELRGKGVSVGWIPADVTDTAGLETLVDHAEAELGPIDILVNNAGVEFGGPYETQSRDELETTVSVNLLAVMELTRLLLPRMRQRGRGHIVNVASMAGRIPSPSLASYSATKHGVVGFTHSLRGELGSDPVGFSAICPIFVSRVGMYGRIEDQVGETPRGFQTVPPEAVGAAVVKAVREDRAEILVTRRPARPLALFAAAAPKAFARVMNRQSFKDFSDRVARARGRI